MFYSSGVQQEQLILPYEKIYQLETYRRMPGIDNKIKI